MPYPKFNFSKKFLLIFLTIPVFCHFSCAQLTENKELEALFRDFANEYKALDIPTLALSYVDNLQNIRSEEMRTVQKALFEKYQIKTKKIDTKILNPNDLLDYQHLVYEIELNLQRLDLENRFMYGKGNEKINHEGVSKQYLGKEWYAYFLKKWLSVEIKPEELIAFGKKEIIYK